MATLAAPVLLLDTDASIPAKRDQFGVAGWTVSGASVDILLDGARLSTVTADANGHYEYQLARWPLTGSHDIVAVAHGADGATATSSTLTVVIGSQPPAVPTISSSFYGAYYIHGSGTFLIGQTTPGATVRISANDVFMLATRADASGFWHVEAPVLADGAYRFSATATTNAGTTQGVATWNVKVDEHAPDAPLLVLGNGVNVLSGDHAAFSGTAEAGTQIALSIDGVVRGETTARTNGRWTVDLDLPVGRHQATATATDGALHVSAASNPLSFSVLASDDPAGDASTKAQLAIGASVQGMIETAGDHDWYKVRLDAKTQYRFTLTAAESNAGTLNMLGSFIYEDYLNLRDPSGADNPEGFIRITPTRLGEPVTILFAPAQSGDYFLDMGASYVTGSYTLSATVAAHDDHANDIAHASTLPLNTRLDGVIDYEGDVDQFSLTLRAGVSYTLTLDSGGAPYGSVLRTLALSGGPVARVAGDGARWDGVVTMSLVPSKDGVYYVGVTGGTGDTVPYHLLLTEAQDDYLASTATTGRVVPGALIHGTLESRADADWFKATLTAGQSYVLQALGEHGERLDLDLFDAAGKQLAPDSSIVYGSNSMLWRAPVSGDYYFQVSSATTPGAYTLLVTPAQDDFGAGAASAGALTPAASVEGKLETPGDTDWLKVRLSVGSDYVFTLHSKESGYTLMSPGQLQLLDAGGLQLAVADSGSPAYSAQLVFHAATTADYYLAVSDPQLKNIGSYGVSMFASSQDAMSADARTGAVLAPGGIITSNIDFATDTDWVRVDLKAQHTYAFELTGTGGRGGTLPSNAMSLEMVDANGAVVVAYSGYPYGKDPTLGYYSSKDATYYLAVSASGSATGSYTLKASDNVTPFLDTLPPLLASSVLPVAAQLLELGTTLYLQFDEAVRLGDAPITLRLGSGELVESFSAGAGDVSLPTGYSSLTLTPKLLAYDTDYVLTLAPGSIFDTSTHPFAGATLAFHTPASPPRQEGSAGNDVFQARDGDQVIDGKAGLDSVVFKGNISSYHVSWMNGPIRVDSVSGAQAHAALIGVERVVFDNFAIAYDTDGNAGQAFRLYQAAFDRKPDQDGLGFWIAQLDHGASLDAAADAFLHSAEFVALYGAANSDQDFVKELYGNVLHRAPDQAGADYWNGRLHDGVSRATVLTAFSESAENQAALIGNISKGMVYHPYH